MDLNSVTIAGRLTRDAELKSAGSGTMLSRFTLAVNRSVKKDGEWTDEAGFFDVNLWGRLAESLNQYLVKGKQVAVTGELRRERWQQDGQNRSRVLIVADRVQLLGGESGGRQDGPADSGGW